MGAKWLEVQRAGSSIRKIGFLLNPPIAPYYTSLIAARLCSIFSSGFVEARHVLINLYR
jgi:hypothetical protein